MENNYANQKSTRIYKTGIRMALIMVIACFCFIGQANAQECYNKNRTNGINAMNSKDYDKAIKWFEVAKKCPDKPANNDLDAKIQQCNNLKASASNAKNQEENKRRQQAEERRRQEEREKWEREQALENERQMSLNAYMNITGIRFYNTNADGQRISKDGDILYAQDVKYLLPVLYYDGMANETRYTKLLCKIFRPNRTMVTFSDSPSGYSFSQNVTVESGMSNYMNLTRWGSAAGGAFEKGNYTIEVYSETGKLIGTYNCTLMEKAPEIKTAHLTLRCNDNNAAIYVNSVFKGTGSCPVELEVGSHNIECRRTNYRSTSRKVDVTLGMNNSTVTLDAPTPMYGSLSVSSNKSDTRISLDGTYRGTAPMTFNNIQVGEHTLQMSRNKYYDISTKVTVTENKTTYYSANMEKIKRQAWLTRREDDFSCVFINPVYGFDESIGGHFTYCGSHIGFFGQYLYGFGDYAPNNSASGGLVLRLTSSVIDLQVLGGATYYMAKGTVYTEYGSYEYGSNKWMGNVGGRISWRSSWGLALWDIMGGVMIDKEEKIPYVGVGLGTTVAGLVTLWALSGSTN
jgi:hypothetical protein